MTGAINGLRMKQDESTGKLLLHQQQLRLHGGTRMQEDESWPAKYTGSRCGSRWRGPHKKRSMLISTASCGGSSYGTTCCGGGRCKKAFNRLQFCNWLALGLRCTNQKSDFRN